MKIYKIELPELLKNTYDYYDSHIIVARSRQRVLDLAKSIAADEGEKAWENAKITYLGEASKALAEKGEAYLLSSFNAG